MPRTPASPPPESAEPPRSEETVIYVPAPSFLDRVRANLMGPLAAALLVGIVTGLLLSMLVPHPANVWALMLLAALVTAAVGFTVRYLATTRGWQAWVPAFVGTIVGVHLMAVTGTVNGPDGPSALLGASSPGFDDALLSALAVPVASMGTLLAGIVAVIIAGWGAREQS